MVRDVERGSDDGGFAGMYTWQPPPRRKHEAWMKARGVPWGFRKVARGVPLRFGGNTNEPF